EAGRNIEFSGVQGRHVITDEEKNYGLTRATEFGTQTGTRYYDLEGSNVVPGTLVITIPNGPTLGDDGQGNIIVTGGNVASIPGLAIGDIVGSIIYTNPAANIPTGPLDSLATVNGRIVFFQDVNPNNAASPAANLLVKVSYESLEIS